MASTLQINGGVELGGSFDGTTPACRCCGTSQDELWPGRQRSSAAAWCALRRLCQVHLDGTGRHARAILPLSSVAGKSITTIEA